MENTLTKITTSSIIHEVNSMDHLKWTEADRLERIGVLNRALEICSNVLKDILESDYSSRTYWKSQQIMVEKYLAICQIGAFKEGTVALNIETKESFFTPYQSEELEDVLDRAKPNSHVIVWGMIAFWVLFFLGCLLT